MPTSTIAFSPELLTTGLQLFFYCFLIFFTIYSAILAYHWLSYGTDHKQSLTAVSIYLLGAAPLVATMAVIAFL